MNVKPDIIARIRLLTTAEGGRMSNIAAGDYGCPVMFGDKGFDCRLIRSENARPLILGTIEEVLVKFLSRDLVEKHLQEGARFNLWEGKVIGEGEILKVYGK